MFLAHFVGDIHQPLHCGFAADYGGNIITVNWYDVKTNLHKVSVLLAFYSTPFTPILFSKRKKS